MTIRVGGPSDGGDDAEPWHRRQLTAGIVAAAPPPCAGLSRTPISIQTSEGAAVAPVQHQGSREDREMPQRGVIEAKEEIRATGERPDLPIVALTAHALSEERARCEAAGMNDFLTKPFQAVELYRAVERWDS